MCRECYPVLVTFTTLCVQRVLEFTGWDPQGADARGIHEIHEAFFEILFDKTAEEGSRACRHMPFSLTRFGSILASAGILVYGRVGVDWITNNNR